MDYSIKECLKDLTENFKEFKFEFYEKKLKGKIPIFFIYCKEESILSLSWEKISEFIAANYQINLMDDYSVWNIYLFFNTANPIKNDLKYQIENDTFSSRKIVVDYISDPEKIINENILNKDLSIEKTHIKKADSIFKHNSLIWPILKDKEAKKKLNQEMKDSFKQLVETIKGKSNEI